MIKILVIGNSFSGKTSIVNRFVKGEFESNYKATVACDFSLKILRIEENEIRLQLWDLVGQDHRVGGINKLFCRGSSGALVVADITNQDSLENTLNWKEQVDTHVAMPNGNPIPMILVVNKYDLIQSIEESGRPVEEYMTQQYLDKFATENGFIGAVRTSAKTGLNVNQAFAQLVREVLVTELTNSDEGLDELRKNYYESEMANSDVIPSSGINMR